MSGRVGLVLKIFALFCVLAVIALIVATWAFFKRPLTLDAWFSRSALGAAGLSRQNATGPDGRLTWFEGGSGDTTLVLLHGAGDQAGTWARVVTPLVERYRVVIPDLAGHGRSDPKEGPIGVGQVVAGVEAILDACCAEQSVVLVGNSLGGWVSFLTALERPQQVERIISINGGPLRLENPTVNLFPSTREDARETMAALMGPSAGSIPDMVLDDIVRRAPTGPAARLASTAQEMDAFLLNGRLEEVFTPVDLVWGMADELLTLNYAEALRDGLPNARLSTIPECGHIPHRECPVDLVETVLQVLNQGPPLAAAEATASEDSPEGPTP